MPANSRHFTIHKKAICDQSHLYTKISRDAFDAAADILLDKYPAAFDLWMILVMNKDGYSADFPTAWISDKYHLSKDKIRRAIEVLQETGYVVESKDGSKWYDFYDVPLNERE